MSLTLAKEWHANIYKVTFTPVKVMKSGKVMAKGL